MSRRSGIAILLAALLAAPALLTSGCGCSEDESADSPAPSRELTRPEALTMLRTVLGELDKAEAGGTTPMGEFFAVPPGGSPQELQAHVAELKLLGAISGPGIDVLERAATWGPVSALRDADRLRRHISAFELDPARCLGFQRDGAEAIFCPGQDGRFRIVRLSGVGKLK